MAVITPTKLPVNDTGKVEVWKWAAVANGDTCAKVYCGSRTDKTVSHHGTDDGGTLAFQGSLDPSDTETYVTLTDVAKTALTGLATPEVMYEILQNCYWLKPVLTGGGAGTNLDIYLMMTRAGSL